MADDQVITVRFGIVYMRPIYRTNSDGTMDMGHHIVEYDGENRVVREEDSWTCRVWAE